jgi:flagellar motor switch protein FliN/FliY
MENINENQKNNSQETQKIDANILLELPVELSVEIGRIRMSFKDLSSLEIGSVININKSPDDLMTIYANGKAIALGEIVMLEEFTGIRIKQILED